jgi:biotin synthase
MSDETQALAFLAGANSIFYGDKLLTTENPEEDQDRKLFAKLGITAEPLAQQSAPTCSRRLEDEQLIAS